MFQWNHLAAAFHSLLGEVKSEDISDSFLVMGKGMLGIFVVMLLIFLVIVILNRATKGKSKSDKNHKE